MERALLLSARHKRHWSLEEAASRIGVDRATLMRWEKGKSMPQPMHIRKLCEVYQATAQELGLMEDSLPLVGAPEQESEALASFRKQDLTARLLHIIFCCHHARYRELQGLLTLELEDSRMTDDQMNRRDALRRLALLPVELCSLSALIPVVSRPNEEILTHCAAGVTACWHLRKGRDLAFADEAVSKYLPTLSALATSASVSSQRTAAADLLVQSLLLKTVLAWHLATPSQAIGYAKQAEHYSAALRESNPTMQILALRTLAAAYCYDQQWDQALRSGEKARYALETATMPISGVVQSYVYAGLATYQSYHQQDTALLSLKKAHTTFFAHADATPTPIWVDHNIGNLLDNDALTHFHLGRYQQADDSFSQIESKAAHDATISLSCRMTAMIEHALAEVDRDDQPRDLDACLCMLTQGVEGARSLQSTRILSSAGQLYRSMRAAWPNEARVKDLRVIFMTPS